MVTVAVTVWLFLCSLHHGSKYSAGPGKPAAVERKPLEEHRCYNPSRPSVPCGQGASNLHRQITPPFAHENIPSRDYLILGFNVGFTL